MRKSRLYKALKFPGRKGLFWLCACALAAVGMSGVELALSLLLQALLQSIGLIQTPVTLPGGRILDASSMTLFGSLLITVGVVRGLMSLLMFQGAITATESINTRLKLLALYDTLVIKRGMHSLAEINTRLGEIFPKASQFCYYGALLASTSVHVLLLAVLMWMNAPEAAYTGLAGIVVVGAIVWTLSRRVRGIANHLPVEHENLTKGIIRIVKNWFLLKALRTSGDEHVGLIRNTLNYSTHSIRANLFVYLSSVIPPILGICLIVALLAQNHAGNTAEPAKFLAFLYLFIRFVQQVAGMALNFGIVSANYPHFRRAAQYYFSFGPEALNAALKPANLLSVTGRNLGQIVSSLEPTTAPQRAPRAPAIVVRDLDFAYGEAGDTASPVTETGRPVLKGVNLEIPPGSRFAITGRSGSGKSTLLALLLGILEPTRGKIEIDGEPPSQYLEKNGASTGYVGPEPFLIQGTLRENLLYGNPDPQAASDEPCFEALRAARLLDWVRSLPQGLEYPLSENGEGLSTGQKQRLSLARALLRRPTLLILDEVSANLDNETEAEVAESLRSLEGSCTTLVVSHRPGMLKNVDRKLALGEA